MTGVLGVLFGLWFVVIGQLGPLFHAATVEHQVCPAHGEQTHGGIDGHPREQAPQDAVTRGSSQDDDHEHCELVSFNRDPALVASVATPLEKLDELSRSNHADVSAATSNAKRYRLAPKQSPPRPV